MASLDLIIIGGGLSGISCARAAQKAGLDFLLLEREAHLGGRMQTSWIDGFGIDRGFQISLTSYPYLYGMDLHDLDPCYYRAGALVWTGTGFSRIEDPLRHFPGSLGPIQWKDLGPLAKIYGAACLGSPRSQLSGPLAQVSCLEYWKKIGLSSKSIEQFFQPFFRGVFFESEGASSAGFFRFLFALFAFGRAFTPARGIGEIPKWLAKEVPEHRFLFGRAMKSWKKEGHEILVDLVSGEQLKARSLVIATAQKESATFGGEKSDLRPDQGTTAFYFSAPESPVKEPILVLNGSGTGLINHFAPLSEVSPALAPTGKALLVANSCGSIGAHRSQEVLKELHNWFGPQVDQWKLLTAIDIPQALPGVRPGMSLKAKSQELAEGVFACGDYLGTPSQDSSFESGALAGERAITFLRDRN
jgi:hypothetical protein